MSSRRSIHGDYFLALRLPAIRLGSPGTSNKDLQAVVVHLYPFVGWMFNSVKIFVGYMFCNSIGRMFISIKIMVEQMHHIVTSLDVYCLTSTLADAVVQFIVISSNFQMSIHSWPALDSLAH